MPSLDRVREVIHDIIDPGEPDFPLKKCLRCGEEKEGSLANFAPYKTSADGLSCFCRPCQIAYVVEWQKANRDKVRASRQKRQQVNREKLAARAKAERDADPEKARANERAYYQKNREKLRAYNRARYAAAKAAKKSQ